MPKLLCVCDEVLNFSLIPSPVEWLMISSVDLDQKFPSEITHSELIAASTIVTLCPNCGRVYIFWNGFNNPPKEYLPVEEESY